jgi:hypothetical protein
MTVRDVITVYCQLMKCLADQPKKKEFKILDQRKLVVDCL